MEYILCSAMHILDKKVHIHQPKNVVYGYVVCGRRHHNCIATQMVLSKLDDSWSDFKICGYTQGFLTNLDRYVTREEGLLIARNANQILNGNDFIEKESLFSEDLW